MMFLYIIEAFFVCMLGMSIVSRTCRIVMLRKARSKASREKSADVIVVCSSI